jgi:hypothetical protein
VSERRRREHELRLAGTRSELTVAQARLAELGRERVRLAEIIARRVIAAQDRARRWHAFCQVRAMVYTRELVRRHPAGGTLTDLGWPRLADPPAWVNELDPIKVAWPSENWPE